MNPDILTEKEDELLGYLKSLFYYPTPDFLSLVDQSLNALTVERRELFLQTLLIQLGFEQTQRRRYIVETLYGQNIFTPGEQEGIVIEVNKRGAAGSTANLVESKPTVTASNPLIPEELTKQAKIFVALATSLTQYQSHLYEITDIGIYFDALRHLPLESQQNLAQSISQFIESVNQTGDKIFNYNPSIPQGIIDLLQPSGLDIAAQKFQSLGEKLEFLSKILAVTQAIVDNETSEVKMDDAQLRFYVALLLFNIKQPLSTNLLR